MNFFGNNNCVRDKKNTKGDNRFRTHGKPPKLFSNVVFRVVTDSIPFVKSISHKKLTGLIQKYKPIRTLNPRDISKM